MDIVDDWDLGSPIALIDPERETGGCAPKSGMRDRFLELVDMTVCAELDLARSFARCPSIVVPDDDARASAIVSALDDSLEVFCRGDDCTGIPDILPDWRPDSDVFPLVAASLAFAAALSGWFASDSFLLARNRAKGNAKVRPVYINTVNYILPFF